MLCFDPTRGIDIRTKSQIYVLLRDLAEAGAVGPALHLGAQGGPARLRPRHRHLRWPGGGRDRAPPRPTSRPCCGPPTTCGPTRCIPEIAAAEAARRRARRGDAAPTQATGPEARPMSAAAPPSARARSARSTRSLAWAQRNGWTLGLLGFLALLLRLHQADPADLRGRPGSRAWPSPCCRWRWRPCGQAIVVISGGIDLSIGSMMALTTVVAASLMEGQSEEFGVAVVLGVLLLGLVLGAVNGGLVVVTRVPDIVVTLAMAFVWAGCALLVLKTPGGGVGGVAQGPGQGIARQRVDPEGGGRPDRHRGPDLDPAPALAARPVDLRHRQQPAGGVPERRSGRSDEGSSPTP